MTDTLTTAIGLAAVGSGAALIGWVVDACATCEAEFCDDECCFGGDDEEGDDDA